MKRAVNQSLPACLLTLTLYACGDGGGGGSSSPDGGTTGGDSTGAMGSGSSGGSTGAGADDHVLWTASRSGKELRAYDMDGKALLNVELSGSPTALITAQGMGIVSTGDGNIYTIASSFGMGDLFTPATPAPNATVSHTIEALATTMDKVWVAHAGDGTSDAVPEVARFRLSDGSEEGHAPVIELNENHEVLLADGAVVWVLVGNGFGLVKLDAATGDVINRIELGENPNDREGPRGEFYGYGDAVVIGARIWVTDNYNKRLLEIDKASMEVTSVRDALPLLGNDAGATYLATDGQDLYLAQSDLDRILRLDGESGEMVRMYDNENGVGRLVVVDGRIYTDADESFGTVEAIDVESGAVVKTFLGVYADFLAVQ